MRAFVTGDSGAARVRSIFAIAALASVAVVSLALITGDPATDQAAPPANPQAQALASLMAGQIRQFTEAQVRERLQTYLSPAERTDAQLRNAQAAWAARIANPRYPDPDLAHDMKAIIDHAMQIRGVVPDAAP